MRTYLQAEGFNVWNVVLTEYKQHATHPYDDDIQRLYEGNAKAMNALMSGVTDSIYASNALQINKRNLGQASKYL